MAQDASLGFPDMLCFYGPFAGGKSASLDNVVTTPHAGAHTAEAVAGMGVMSVQNLINVLSGKPCPNIVNR